MKKSRNRIPRPIKATLYLFLLLSLILLIYFILGSPPLTKRMAFRKAERGNMVGPSKIIAEYSGGNVVVAETDYEYIIFNNNSDSLNYDRFYNPIKENESVYNFHTYKKTENMILANLINYHARLQFLLFDRNSKAVRAELEGYICHQYNDTEHTTHILLEASRGLEPFFLFSYPDPSILPEQTRSALYELERQCASYRTDKATITVRLYDAQGNLIQTEEISPGPSL